MPRTPPGPALGSPVPDSSALELDALELASLVGRSRAVEELLELMASSRLLTLTGPGGSGKTRLALEVARRLRGAGTRVAWVELASVDDPASLPTQILDALGIRAVGAPSEPAELAPLLGSDSLVLGLDNCEHLVEACASLVEGLLRAHPRLGVLATSREALGVRGERAWLVPPLPLPPASGTLDQVAAAPAVRLFVERARETRADFRLTEANVGAVAEICTRLDGIPLAIELAAARVRVLSPEQIRDRLGDALRLLSGGARTAVPRHRTLRATFQWSYDLLLPEGRLLLQRLSVFRGGFTLDAAEAVAGDGAPESDHGTGPGRSGAGPEAQSLGVVDVLDGITRLADRSLLQMREEDGAARYILLETIRQYTAARLDESGEEDRMRDRHARYMVRLAEAAAPHVFGGRGTPGWMERLEREDANVRAALDRTLPEEWDGAPTQEARSHVELGLRLATALLWYWFAQGRFADGRALLLRGLDRAEGIPAPVRARARIALSHLAFWQGEHGEVGPLAREALEELGAHPDPFWRAMALIALGMAAHLDERFEEAAPPLDEAVALVRTLDHPTLTVFALYWRGLAAQGQGDREMARASLEEAGELGAAAEDPAAASHPRTMLGRLLVAEGDLDRAREHLGRSLVGHWEAHDRWGMVLALEGIAGIAAAEGRLTDTARILAGTATLRRSMNAVPTPADRVLLDRTLVAARDALGADRFQVLQREGASLGPEGLMALAGAITDPPSSTEEGGAAAEPVGVAAEAAGAPTDAGTRPPTRTPERSGEGLVIRALGPLEVEADGRLLDPEGWSYSRPRELLVYLLLRPRGGTREEIGSALWPEATPPQAKNSFHVTLHHLRKQLGRPEWVVLEADRYRLAPEAHMNWDGEVFESGLRPLLEKGRDGEVDPARLRALLAIYRGELLEGAPAGRWLEEARDRFRRLKADGHLLLAQRLLDAGDATGAVAEFEAVLREEELNEEAHRGVMAAWARAGHRDRALRHFERLEVILQEVLEARPEDATMTLHQRIRDGDQGGDGPLM